MDDTSLERQKRYRDKLKGEGKRQRVFFLSDAAMEQIKKRKDETNSPSVNHALEALLTEGISAAPGHPEVIEQAQRFVEQHESMVGQESLDEATKNNYLVELGKLIALVKAL